MKKHACVIIPTYNEKNTITLLLTQITSLAKKHSEYKWSVIVVDDNSPDGTAEYVKKYKTKILKLYLNSGAKQGLGRALCRGIKQAIFDIGADIVITNEADFAYDTNYIATLLKKIETGYEVVFTTRHAKTAGVEGWDINRRANHFIANTIFASWIAGMSQISDHNGLLRAATTPILKRINWDDIPTSGFSFVNYWSFLLLKNCQNFTQIPIIYKFRTQGESKVSFNKKYIKTYIKDVLEYIKICIKIRLNNESKN